MPGGREVNDLANWEATVLRMASVTPREKVE